MGTEDEINRTQQAIKDVLKRIGMNPRQFAGRYFDDTIHSDDENERQLFYDKFKHQMRRSGKGVKVLGQLEAYLNFIYSMGEFKKAGLIAPRNIHYPELDENFRRGMRRISQSIDQTLMDKSTEHEDTSDDT